MVGIVWKLIVFSMVVTFAHNLYLHSCEPNVSITLLSVLIRYNPQCMAYDFVCR